MSDRNFFIIKTKTMSQVLEKKSLSSTEDLHAYLDNHDVQFIAEDAVFTNMGTGEKTIGRDAIAQMLHYVYHVAFDARAELKHHILTEDKAMIECNFSGKHIGEFAGFPASNKIVNMPLCVSYDLEEGLIKQGRIYMLVNPEQLKG